MAGSNRAMVIRILANMQGVERALRETRAQVTATAKSLSTNFGNAIKNNSLLLQRMATVGAAAFAAMVAASVKAASDFESSFTGVIKTVGEAEAAAAGLSGALRQMATEIPININALNKIAESAGQLGIRAENIVSFTNVMADLGVTTNLSGTEAATSLARLANITGLSQDEFSNLGSAIVDLGNNFATTEAEITEFALRIAGAGEVAGLTEAQILATGAAMSSVGVKAEAGGTAVQKVLLNMTEAVATGNASLAIFAATSGQTADQFARSFRVDAAGAFTAFVEGLGRSGDDAFKILDELNLKDQRLIRSFLSLSNAGGLLADAMDTSTAAFAENTALAKEAEIRHATFGSQVTLLKNSVQDLAISIGTELLPVIKTSVTEFKTWADGLRDSGVVVEFASNSASVLEFTMKLLGPTLEVIAGNVKIVTSQMELFGVGMDVARDSLKFWSLGLIDFKTASEQAEEAQRQVIDAAFEQTAQLTRAAIAAAKHTERMQDWQGANLDLIPTVDDVTSAADREKAAVTRLTQEIKQMVLEERRLDLSFREGTIAVEDQWMQLGTLTTRVLATSEEFKNLDVVIPQVTQNLVDLESVANSTGKAAEDAAKTIGDAFRDTLGDLNNIFQAAFEGGGGLGGAFSSLSTNLTGGLLSLIPGIGPVIGQFAGAIAGGFKSLFGGIFGGASEAQLAARELVKSFTDEFVAGLNSAQLAEAAAAGFENIADAALTVGVRDLFVAAGKSAAEGEAAVARLWDAIRDGGPAAVEAALASIQEVSDAAENLANLQIAIAEREVILQQVLQDGVAAFQAFKESGLAAGVEIPEAFRVMLEAAELLKDELVGPLINGAIAAGNSLKSLDTIGQISGKNFAQFGAAMKAAFNKAVAGGASAEAALEAMRPAIATLILLQDKYKFTVDDGTQALLDQGREAGITGAEAVTAADRQLEATNNLITSLERMVEIFTNALPRGIGAVNTEIGRIPRRVNIDVGFDFDDFNFDFPEGFVSGRHGTGGRFVDFGAGTPAILHGRERIVTEQEGRTEATGMRDVTAAIRTLDRNMRDRALRNESVLPEAIKAAIEQGLA